MSEPNVPNFEPEELISAYFHIRRVVWQYVKKFLTRKQQQKLAPYKPSKEKKKIFKLEL